ncbi:MAG: type VI secretion system baseplate subunit TssE [Desulfobacterium sp.]|nr:type VI secretion system baseplate subunit TssE [Desulfobacterium sp.]
MSKPSQTFQASVLDRLIDHEPDNSRESARYRVASFRQIMAAVRRDLENLLNTRRSIIIPPAAYGEVNTSFFVYGLPDYTSKNPSTLSVQSQLRLEIEKTIARFEPRLKRVAVEVDSPEGTNRHLTFRIAGILVVDELAEPVTFNTTFDSNRSTYSIKK